MIIQKHKKKGDGFNERRASRYMRRFERSRFIEKAKEHQSDDDFLRKLKIRAKMLTRVVKRAGNSVQTVLDYVFGKESDWLTRIQAIAALIYFVTPADFLPDVLVGIGYLDDILILGKVVSNIAKNISEKKSADVTEVIRKEIPKGKKMGIFTRRPAATRQLEEEKQIPIQDPKRLTAQRNKELVNVAGQVMGKAKDTVSEIADEQIEKMIRMRLIIVIISLGGAVLAAGIAVLLKTLGV